MKISDQLKKTMAMVSTPEEEMRDLLLSLAREANLDEGHALPQKLLLAQSMKLNPKQKAALIPALKKLVEEGLFNETSDGRILLTRNGKDFLY